MTNVNVDFKFFSYLEVVHDFLLNHIYVYKYYISIQYFLNIPDLTIILNGSSIAEQYIYGNDV